MERYILKQRARDQLRGNWAIVILTFLVGGVISGCVSFFTRFSDSGVLAVLSVIIEMCIGGIIAYGLASFSLNIAKGRNFEFTDIFDGFKEGIWLKSILLTLIIGVVSLAGYLLLIVPGIILTLMFSQSFYILCEDNNKTIRECLDESMNMMNGHKMELFVLYLSFIGWWLLAICTCGIAALWITPYMQITCTNFYLALRENTMIEDPYKHLK